MLHHQSPPWSPIVPSAYPSIRQHLAQHIPHPAPLRTLYKYVLQHSANVHSTVVGTVMRRGRSAPPSISRFPFHEWRTHLMYLHTTCPPVNCYHRLLVSRTSLSFPPRILSSIIGHCSTLSFLWNLCRMSSVCMSLALIAIVNRSNKSSSPP